MTQMSEAQNAYAMAGYGPADMNVAGIYGLLAALELIAGHGIDAIATRLLGRIPAEAISAGG